MSATHHGGGHGPAPTGRPSRLGVLAMVAFGAILLFFLVTEHRTHLYGALPMLAFILVLLCPLLHVFMHRGHGGHGGAPQGADRDAGDSRRKAGAARPPHQH